MTEEPHRPFYFHPHLTTVHAHIRSFWKMCNIMVFVRNQNYSWNVVPHSNVQVQFERNGASDFSHYRELWLTMGTERGGRKHNKEFIANVIVG